MKKEKAASTAAALTLRNWFDCLHNIRKIMSCQYEESRHNADSLAKRDKTEKKVINIISWLCRYVNRNDLC